MAGRLAWRAGFVGVARGRVVGVGVWAQPPHVLSCLTVPRECQPVPRFPHWFNRCLFSAASETELRVEDEFYTHHTTPTGQHLEGRLNLLLLLSARENDAAAVSRLLQQAQAAGVRPSTHTLESILAAYISNKNLGAAAGLYRDTEHIGPLDSCVVLGLCTLMIENGDCRGATETLRTHIQTTSRPDTPSKTTTEAGKTLLNAAATVDYEAAKGLLDVMLAGVLVEPGPQVLAPLLQAKLEGDDIAGTVEVAEYIYSTFHTLPKRMEILIRILNRCKQAEEEVNSVLGVSGEVKKGGGGGGSLLGRMFALVSQHYGVTQARHDLLFACIESGHPTAARLVLQDLGNTVDERQVLRLCKLYAKNQREAALENLLAASCGTDTLDRLRICEILLDAYRLSGTRAAAEKGLSLWRAMVSEGLDPTPAFLSSLTTLLTSYDIKVPF